MRPASRRRIRPQAAWNVITHIVRATPPTSSSSRRFISLAARFVKVIARTSFGFTPIARISWTIRCVSTRVFPEPAPATTSTGPSGAVTASRWAGFRSAR